jgi:hypothetical protein
MSYHSAWPFLHAGGNVTSPYVMNQRSKSRLESCSVCITSTQ